MSLNFYDISDNQGDINNTLVPGDAVFIKATEGVGYTDPDCDANYQQAKGAGKLLGVYHFARPDGNAAVDEAKWFVSQIQGYIGEAILALDFETNPMTVEWAKEWLDEVYNLTQVRPIIYMTTSTANLMDWSSVWANYGLWVASWGINAPQNGYTPSTNVNVNGNWNTAAWQYTSKGRLSNWSGYLDLNVFFGDASAWHKYAERYVAPAPTPEPTPVVTQPVTTTPVSDPAPVSSTPVTTEPTTTDTTTPVPTPVDTTPTEPTSSTVVATKPSSLQTFFTRLWKLILGFVKEIK